MSFSLGSYTGESWKQAHLMGVQNWRIIVPAESKPLLYPGEHPNRLFRKTMNRTVVIPRKVLLRFWPVASSHVIFTWKLYRRKLETRTSYRVQNWHMIVPAVQVKHAEFEPYSNRIWSHLCIADCGCYDDSWNTYMSHSRYYHVILFALLTSQHSAKKQQNSQALWAQKSPAPPAEPCP